MKKLVAKLFYKFFNPLFKEIYHNRLLIKINSGYSRGSASLSILNIDIAKPSTWEFGGFSQNGEDGIIQVLLSQLNARNQYFLEIGASNCIDNNTAWLAFVKNYSGLMIEGDTKVYKESLPIKPWYIDYRNMFVRKDNVAEIAKWLLYKEPDVLSLDIDGNDYYIASRILEEGIRPKIIICEYNSAFGPNNSITIEYKDDFVCSKAHSSMLYYGVSVSGWKNLLNKYHYKFITVDTNGVNAFFVDPKYFNPNFIANIKGLSFSENLHQLRKFKCGWEKQFQLISNLVFHNV